MNDEYALPPLSNRNAQDDPREIELLMAELKEEIETLRRKLRAATDLLNETFKSDES